MRILILTKKIPYPTHDGESMAIMQLASNFSLLENEIHMLCMQTQKHPYKLNEIPKNILDSLNLSAVFINTNITYARILLNFFKSIPFQFERFISKEYSKQLKMILEKDTYDIIQLEGYFLVPYIDAIRKESKAKIILRSHNIENKIWKSYAKNEKNWFKKIFLLYQSNKMARYEKKHTSKLDVIVPISLSDFKWYQQNTQSKHIKYIPYGIESRDYQQKEFSNEGIFYFIGALDWLPNIQGITWFIQKVLPLILIKFPAFKIHIAGRNASKKLLHLFQQNVIFYGEVDDAFKFIQDKEFCIVPLLSGSGMKIKIAEALSYKKIVITTSIGIEGYPDGAEAVVQIADSAQDFANSIIHFIENKSQISEMKNAAYQYALQHFDSKEVTKTLLEYYKTL